MLCESSRQVGIGNSDWLRWEENECSVDVKNSYTAK